MLCLYMTFALKGVTSTINQSIVLTQHEFIKDVDSKARFQVGLVLENTSILYCVGIKVDIPFFKSTKRSQNA